ncbi:MAG: threonine dehydratase [Planctomycetaceae bacterium]|nr:threonine dehydratase [Planctomycetaceae bacterium]
MVPGIGEIEVGAGVVYEVMSPTAAYCWPLLNQRLGGEVWVKHENQTPIGAFKLRVGLVYFADLHQGGTCKAVVTATRGNHGQSVAFSARRYGLSATVVVPLGNSVEKNAAMRGLGAKLVEVGEDFQAAREEAARLAEESGGHMVPSFHPLLVRGVASYALELFRGVEPLDRVYVPIGLGSGICGTIAVRNALSPKTKVIGVVSAEAPAYSVSFRTRTATELPVTTRLADGMACRRPEPEALDILWRYADEIVEVSDEEVAEGMRMVFECTHNCAEGAGAAAIAAIAQSRDAIQGKRVGAVISGGNVDREVFARVLAGES